MFLKKMEVKNFRLLQDFKLNFKKDLSLVIGKNNCGKTSVITVLDKMLSSSKITWEDINLDKQKELYETIINFDYSDSEGITELEGINLKLFIEYSDEDSYKNIQKFMMDLNPNNNIIVLEFSLLIPETKVIGLKNIIDRKQIEDFISFSKYISKKFTLFFELKRYSRGYDVESQRITLDRSEEIDSKNIRKVIRVIGVRADRTVSNDDRNHSLSSLTGKYFSAYKASENQSDTIFSDLEWELEKADKALYNIYNGNGETVGIFSNVINTIKTYGGRESGIDIAIESSISEKNLLSDHTSLSYRQGEDSSLPETYNGLGYLNLISILFEIETRIQELFEQPADINFLYIEEPEAHTHPQLQYIFIRNIKSHIATHRNKLLTEKNSQLQVLMTSHSSHIVSECDFDDIIYLKNNNNSIEARSFNSLRDQYDGDEERGFKFVKKYLTLNRSELFFTDKVICIEGDTERILMPMMMLKVDNNIRETSEHMPLLSQNISIIEVGAHSHIFIPLFKFLGIKVLIITDIDAAKKTNGRYEKEKPLNAEHTSNASIRHFFEGTDLEESENQFTELVGKEESEKIKDNIRIAYQIPEPDDEDEYQASSFEDAFISLNKNFILRNREGLYNYGALKKIKEDEIEDIYEFSLKKIAKKTAFASSLLYFNNEDGASDEKWKVPYYIVEGLLWLQQD